MVTRPLPPSDLTWQLTAATPTLEVFAGPLVQSQTRLLCPANQSSLESKKRAGSALKVGVSINVNKVLLRVTKVGGAKRTGHRLVLDLSSDLEPRLLGRSLLADAAPGLDVSGAEEPESPGGWFWRIDPPPPNPTCWYL